MYISGHMGTGLVNNEPNSVFLQSHCDSHTIILCFSPMNPLLFTTLYFFLNFIAWSFNLSLLLKSVISVLSVFVASEFRLLFLSKFNKKVFLKRFAF